jgi:hypothetical protein
LLTGTQEPNKPGLFHHLKKALDLDQGNLRSLCLQCLDYVQQST